MFNIFSASHFQVMNFVGIVQITQDLIAHRRIDARPKSQTVLNMILPETISLPRTTKRHPAEIRIEQMNTEYSYSTNVSWQF